MELFYSYVLSPAVLVLILLCGAWFFVKLRCFWIRHPKKSFQTMVGKGVTKDVFHAVTMALAGTLGVGNIVGVSLAILVGGPGAVFWMVVTAFFAMGVKYAEVALTIQTREATKEGWVGGAPYYMRTKGHFGKWLPPIFSILCLACAVTQGCLIQANAVKEAFLPLGISPLLVGAALTVLAGVCLSYGKEGIGKLTAKLIPYATFVYLALCLGVIFFHCSQIPRVCSRICKEAWTKEAGVGGIFGFLFTPGAKVGCARGLLSNEAGCGTSPLAHVTADNTHPKKQGLWGIFEVFLDTVVICTLTALTALCAHPQTGDESAPLSYLNAAFASVFGTPTPYLTAGIIFAFAFSTILTWSHYGISCLHTLTKHPFWHILYRCVLLIAIPLGAVMSVKTAYRATDILLALMTCINIPYLFWHTRSIAAVSQDV